VLSEHSHHDNKLNVEGRRTDFMVGKEKLFQINKSMTWLSIVGKVEVGYCI
jgi:hypothetical protein